jgi:hypothetical protein
VHLCITQTYSLPDPFLDARPLRSFTVAGRPRIGSFLGSGNVQIQSASNIADRSRQSPGPTPSFLQHLPTRLDSNPYIGP